MSGAARCGICHVYIKLHVQVEGKRRATHTRYLGKGKIRISERTGVQVVGAEDSTHMHLMWANEHWLYGLG